MIICSLWSGNLVQSKNTNEVHQKPLFCLSNLLVKCSYSTSFQLRKEHYLYFSQGENMRSTHLVYIFLRQKRRLRTTPIVGLFSLSSIIAKSEDPLPGLYLRYATVHAVLLFTCHELEVWWTVKFICQVMITSMFIEC